MKIYKAVHERENKCKELHKEMNALENELHRMKRVEARRKWRYVHKRR